MSKTIKIFVASSFLLSLFSCTGQSINSQYTKGIEGVLDSLVPALLRDNKVPGVQITVIRGGKISFAKGYGYADIIRKKKVTNETIFQIGSVSKSLTAWGVMKLAEEGKINIDSPIVNYIKRWRFPLSSYDITKVTVRKVLSHTAGLNVRGYNGVFLPNQKLISLAESLSGYKGSDGGLSLVREPGSEAIYSSGGYTLLQMLIEDVSERTFAEFITESIFIPLGMTKSVYTWNHDLAKKVATPYNANQEQYPHYQFVEQGSGGCYTTASDLAKFVAQIFQIDSSTLNSAVLSKEAIKSMISPAENTNGLYGLGYKLFPVSEKVHLIAHDGANDGWRAQFMIDPISGDGLVVLINSDEGGKIVAPIICSVFGQTKVDMSPLCNSLKK